MATLTGKTIGQLALLTGITSDTLFAVEYSGMTFHIPYSGLSIGESSYVEITYDELYSIYGSGALTPGTFYLITDFQSIYDQPDFDSNGEPIVGTTKTGDTKPLLVFATGIKGSLSEKAFSPSSPFDIIHYDINFNFTEATKTPAKGRITERIDEYNNRTDYDHRNILFKRYRLYTIRQDYYENGTVELLSDGTVNGTNTRFTNYSIGDVVFIAGSKNFYEITGITDNVTMSVSGDTINPTGPGSLFYLGIEESNGKGDYFSYKKTNVKSTDYVEYKTFGDAIFNNYAINNYVGNYSNNSQSTFILANNVFLQGEYENNKLGNNSFNNTFGADNSNNSFGNFCYNNVSTNDMDENIIGEYFNSNLINTNFENNIIGNNFEGNYLVSENGGYFRNNSIDNKFNGNFIYSKFYDNKINYSFSKNIIGDYGNLNNLEFYRNNIGNNFNQNKIRREFQNNRISTNFQNNIINGEFIGNTILNGFNYNQTGDYFGVNEIGNAFNNNYIYDGFYNNKTNYYFNNNITSYDFFRNSIGTYFTNNKPTNYTSFGWGNLFNVSSRTYDIFNDVVGGGGIGNKILGKEFVMRIISTSQYFLIKFTQWTIGGNGGGFQYERTEIDSSGNNLGPTVYFTKKNNGNQVDIIVPGVVEITRGNQNGIYNSATEMGWNSSQSPLDTEWNSIYTQNNNGNTFNTNIIGNYFNNNIIDERFAYNQIANNFYNNTIGTDFGSGGGGDYGNIIADQFTNNVIGNFFYSNHINTYFTNNTIGDNFETNQILNYFQSNTIDDNFEKNKIGNNFKKNTIGLNFISNTIGDNFGNDGGGSPGFPNTIFDDFQFNQIGNNFGNDGTNIDGGNLINSGFKNNVIGDDFYFNLIDADFTNNKIGNQSIFNSIGIDFVDNQINNVFVGNTIVDELQSNKIGNYFGFNTIGNNFKRNVIGDFFGNAGSGTENNILDDFTDNQIGNFFGNDGSNLAGGNTISNSFTKNQILSTKVYNYDFTSATYVYDSNMNKIIFDRQDGTPRLSYYDNSDVLNITNIDN